jgi:hypothetical protein
MVSGEVREEYRAGVAYSGEQAKGIAAFCEYYCTKEIMSKFYKVNIKPLSVNKAWKGRRYATKESKSYQKELWHI